jgi:predicted glutamine amidotransferase
MCGVYGFILKRDGYIPGMQRRRVVRGLGTAAEVRGKDATGVAFPDPVKGKLKVEKAPIRASNFPFYKNLPLDVTAVIGHTRATTQGSEFINENNHPFKGVTKNGQEFVLAHNGMIWNDRELKVTNALSYTIETDSYVAVALLQKHNEINMDSVKAVAEKLEGSFVLTILAGDRVVFVKHDNPLTIYDFKELGFLLYASTEDILLKGLKQERKLWKYYKNNKDKVDVIQPKEDSIMIYDRIKDTWETGKFEAADFIYSYRRSFWWGQYTTKKRVLGTYKKGNKPQLMLPEKLNKPLTEITWDDFYVDTINMYVYTPSGVYTIDDDWLYEDVIINKYGEYEWRGLWFPYDEDIAIYRMALYLYGKYWADKYYVAYVLGDDNKIREGV